METQTSQAEANRGTTHHFFLELQVLLLVQFFFYLQTIALSSLGVLPRTASSDESRKIFRGACCYFKITSVPS